MPNQNRSQHEASFEHEFGDGQASDAHVMQTLSFSLAPAHVGLLRAAAARSGVSQSRIVRDALDHYFPERVSADGSGDAVVSKLPQGTSVPALTGLVRELAAFRREIAGIRNTVDQINRELAHERGGSPLSSQFTDLDHLIGDVSGRMDEFRLRIGNEDSDPDIHASGT